MRFDKLTVKAQEAIAGARDLAAERRHAEAGPEHLAHVLMTQEGGVAARVLTTLGAPPDAIVAELDQRLSTFSRAHGTAVDVGLSRALKEVWEAAAGHAANMKDEFLSTEHLLLALADTKGFVGDTLRAAGSYVAPRALPTTRTRPCGPGSP